MKTRLIASLTALTLAAFSGASAMAEQTAGILEWQQPGYVMDVVVVKAPRPEATVTTAAESADAVLASEQDGYVMDVVVVRASRSEVLAEAREAARRAALARQELFREAFFRNGLGAPAR